MTCQRTHTVIINKADKGNTVVVEDRTDYIRNAMTHLNNKDVYERLTGDPTTSLKKAIEAKRTELNMKVSYSSHGTTHVNHQMNTETQDSTF